MALNNLKHLIVLAALVLLFLHGCSSTPIITRILPANVMAQPVGTVGIISPIDNSPIITAMQALGIPYYRVPVDSMARLDHYSFPQIILDEGALEDDRVMKAYRIFFDQIRKGPTLIMLRQNPETMRKLFSSAFTVLPRSVEYTITFVPPRREHPILTTPNIIFPADLDSLSRFAHQLARGDRAGHAVIAANLQSPDSSAALLLQPSGHGAVWYVGFPIAQRAAAGYEAEQKLLANMLSYTGK